MPVFEYKGLNEGGKPVSGFKEADSAKALRVVLRKEGVYLTGIAAQVDAPMRSAKSGSSRAEPTGALSKDVDFRKLTRGRITMEDVAITTRQLATLLGAGVTLVESLTALVDQVEKEKLKRVLSDVKQRVNEGSSLADALQTHVKVFGPLYVNMIRAGEASGALESVLQRLADFTEGQARLQQKIIGALTYPLILLVIGMGTLTFLMAVVIPQVTKIFDTMKQTLPWTTQLLIGTSALVRGYWFILFPALFGGVYWFVRWSRSETGKPIFDRKILKAPLVGNMMRLIVVARFTRTLATLLKSGVPLLTAMDIVKNVVTNVVMADVVEKVRDSVREGESIANPLKRSGEFPPLVYHMVAVGEKSGQLEDMLVSVANTYENQVEVRLQALVNLLGPIMIVGMGIAIAFVAFSIITPIMQINASVR